MVECCARVSVYSNERLEFDHALNISFGSKFRFITQVLVSQLATQGQRVVQHLAMQTTSLPLTAGRAASWAALPSSRQCIANNAMLRAPRLTINRQRQPQQAVHASTIAAPASLDVKKMDGTATGSEQLALKVAEETARGLVHRCVIAAFNSTHGQHHPGHHRYLVTVRQNARRGTACTKTRAEVRGGGRKPYAQKGTGNARMGSKRSPLLPGGGVTFGPRPRDWSIKMNKKEKRLAMATAIQSAADSITVVEDLKVCAVKSCVPQLPHALLQDSFTEIKTKTMVDALKAWGVEEKEYALLVLNELDETVHCSGRNIKRLQVCCMLKPKMQRWCVVC